MARLSRMGSIPLPSPGRRMTESRTKPNVDTARAWREARALLRQHRGSLALGLFLMLISRLAGLVLPASTKYLIDEVIGKHNGHLLLPLALGSGAATLLQAITSYANSQVVSVAAQRAIMTMRQRVQDHILRLPIRYFDSTKSGVVIARVMNDAEGVRNLVGTGIIQLVGGVLTAGISLAVLFWLNWKLTLATIVFLGIFGGAIPRASSKVSVAGWGADAARWISRSMSACVGQIPTVSLAWRPGITSGSVGINTGVCCVDGTTAALGAMRNPTRSSTGVTVAGVLRSGSMACSGCIGSPRSFRARSMACSEGCTFICELCLARMASVFSMASRWISAVVL